MLQLIVNRITVEYHLIIAFEVAGLESVLVLLQDSAEVNPNKKANGEFQNKQFFISFRLNNT